MKELTGVTQYTPRIDAAPMSAGCRARTMAYTSGAALRLPSPYDASLNHKRDAVKVAS